MLKVYMSPFQNPNFEQESIPVGCILSTAVAAGGLGVSARVGVAAQGLCYWFPESKHLNDLGSHKSRISLRWGHQPSTGGHPHMILPNFSKNCMELKEFGPLGGGQVPHTHLRSANARCLPRYTAEHYPVCRPSTPVEGTDQVAAQGVELTKHTEQEQPCQRAWSTLPRYTSI